MDKIDINDWEDVRDEIKVNLVVVDVTKLDMKDDKKRDYIKNLSLWIDIFKNKYDKLMIKKVYDHANFKTLLVLEGTHKETDQEFRDRMGIEKENSWSVKYMELVNCTEKEAKIEMVKMIKNGKPLTPKEWLDKKKKQVNCLFGEDET